MTTAGLTWATAGPAITSRPVWSGLIGASYVDACQWTFPKYI